MAICLNGFLVWVYWTYLPVVLAEEHNEEEEKRVIDIDYFEDGSMLVYLSDGTKAHGMHSFLPERGFEYDNSTIYFQGAELLGR